MEWLEQLIATVPQYPHSDPRCTTGVFRLRLLDDHVPGVFENRRLRNLK